jgi:hypothetical protein
VADCIGLENRQRRKAFEGSNPSPSAYCNTTARSVSKGRMPLVGVVGWWFLTGLADEQVAAYLLGHKIGLFDAVIESHAAIGVAA